jgi:hypothetical protein
MCLIRACSRALHPVEVRIVASAHHVGVTLGQLGGDGPRTGDGAVVHRVHRRHLRCRAHQKRLVSGVQIAAHQVALHHLVAHVAQQPRHGVLGDALERAGVQWRRGDSSVAHGEQVFAGAFGDQTGPVQEHRLVIPGVERLHFGQRRVDVVAGGLGRRGHDVVVMALPGADLQFDALGHCVIPQVGPPRPAGDGNVHLQADGRQAHFAVSVVRDRAHVTAVKAGRCHRLFGGGHQLVLAVGHRHHEDVRRTLETGDVIGQAENARPVRGRIGPNTLEHAGAVVEGVGEHVDLCLVPRNQRAVHPDEGRGGEWHGGAPDLGGWPGVWVVLS